MPKLTQFFFLFCLIILKLKISMAASSVSKNDEDIEVFNKEGRTRLMEAARFNEISLARDLISRGANVNKRNDRGSTALSISVGCGNIEMVELLLDNKADVNLASFTPDQHDLTKFEEFLHPIILDPRLCHETPLWTAVRYNRLEIAKLLISKKADIKTRVSSGRTLLAMSSAMGNLRMAILLLEAGCDPNESDKDGFDAWSSCRPEDTGFWGYDKGSGSDMAARVLIYREFMKFGFKPNMNNKRLTNGQLKDIRQAEILVREQ
jgi:ankyrin repeat protein